MDLLGRHGGLVRDLLDRRLPAELRPQRPLGPVDLLHALDDVDGHADRSRLVGQGARDGLPDPPGRVRRELEAAPPVELLDRADQAQRALLDEIEEGEALVAVVLRDRDDQTEIRLDHLGLRRGVPALDPLRERHFLRCVQQPVSAGLTEEELERVGRRLDRSRRDGRPLDGWSLDDLDAALVELPHEGLVLEPAELVRLDDLRDVGRADRARLLGHLEERPEVVLTEEWIRYRRLSRGDARESEGAVGTAPCEVSTVRVLLASPRVRSGTHWRVAQTSIG